VSESQVSPPTREGPRGGGGPLGDGLVASEAESTRDKRVRASKAARRALQARVAELGAVTLPDAAAARGIDATRFQKWVSRGHSKSAFRGPRNAWCFREHQLDAELEDWQCAWEGCSVYALLCESEPRLCRHHVAAVRRDGKLTATEFAEEYGLDPPSLLDRLMAGEIPGERIERGGRPVAWLLDQQKAPAVLEDRFRCRWHKGCNSFTVSPTLHCSDHAGAAAAIKSARGKVVLVCADCGETYEDYPSQIKRKGDLCHDCNLASEEFDRKRRQALEDTWDRRYDAWGRHRGQLLSGELADDFGLARSPSLAGNLTRPSKQVPRKAAHERVKALGVEAVLIDREDAYDRRRERLRTDGRARAALDYERERFRLAAARIVTTKKQRDQLKERFGVRESWRQRLSPGAPPATDRNERWLRRAEEIVASAEDQLIPNDVYGHVFLLDWQGHPETWPRDRYPSAPRDPDSPHPNSRKAGIDKVRKQIDAAVKALLIERK
jgi:hypothetical protein